MKKTGRITCLGIAIIVEIIQFLFLSDFTKTDTIIHVLILLIIAWMLGYLFDKMKFYIQRMNESEKYYKQLIETIPDAIVIHYQDIIIYVNESGKNMLGAQKKEEVVGMCIYDFINLNYKEIAKKRMDDLRRDHKTTNNVEQKLIRLDKKTIYIEISSRSIIYEGKEAILSVFKDITDKKVETEGLLQKSEKLALVGQMAAGIAHEIRNPLTSIQGFIQLFKSKYPSDAEHFTLVLSELERINLIVGEFLVLAKPTAVIFKEKAINKLIQDVVTLTNTQAIMSNIQIFVESESYIPPIICEENQLKQVFINILKNSIEAMPNGGIIDVKIKLKENDKVSIRIMDQGVGIPENRIPTLGEPFYTTKEKGTGLGLMTSYTIIDRHEGELKISSKVNEGTTVEVILPVCPPSTQTRQNQ
ncbi:ATP-binding protein [Bacillus benzoevorans]|uniref:histidine kinase n=1 Tax=Bacillus benzoevorans TaxID=1456 RepID=A0A7X0HRJ7_9BACI|nr:ATP-binding protein [Bacillus benzoevorans]MBB6444305.1 two-component system sporulation sensor kinase A [Bacillus benzoevorans]